MSDNTQARGDHGLTPTISSLALLKVNYDTFGKDYLENFVPMVAECIRHSREEVVSLPDLQDQLRIRFGLSLPQATIKTLLKRVSKLGYVRLENGVYYRNSGELEVLEFKDVRQRVMDVHDSLIREFGEFCFQNFGVEMGTNDADAAIASYLEENQLLVMDAVKEGTVIPKSGRSVRNARFLVASFIRHLQETHSASLGHLEMVVKGHMLANAIFLPNIGSAGKRFHDTEVYLDTPFLIKALGYEGGSQAAPCLELLELLEDTGAALRCFSHTRDEISGVLEWCAGQLEANGSNGAADRNVLRTFRSEGLKATDIMRRSNNLERDLNKLSIRIVDKPEHERTHQIDEETLRVELEKNVPYNRTQPVLRDIDSISAIVRLRKDKKSKNVEECGAVFVTTNSKLASFASRYFSEGAGDRSITPCLTDYALTNILWLKRPTAKPDLPSKRIIADCYAATRPTEELWRQYLQEIGKLKQENEIDATEYFMLRNSTLAESALADATMGQEEGFTEGTVSEVREKLRSNLEAEKQVEVDTERAARESAENEIRAGIERDTSRRTEIRNNAEKWAYWITKVPVVVIVVLLTLATAYSFPWELPAASSFWWQYLLSLAFAILLVLSIAGIMYGTTVRNLSQRAEVKVANWIERQLLALTGERD